MAHAAAAAAATPGLTPNDALIILVKLEFELKLDDTGTEVVVEGDVG